MFRRGFYRSLDVEDHNQIFQNNKSLISKNEIYHILLKII